MPGRGLGVRHESAQDSKCLRPFIAMFGQLE
jgi:hypothetical protein